MAKLVIACEGYRLTGLGHHYTAFEALELAMGAEVQPLTAYFDQCRRQRNMVDYDMANVASNADAELLISKAEEFRGMVRRWIKRTHPQFAK